jgi:hypothetical protein
MNLTFLDDSLDNQNLENQPRLKIKYDIFGMKMMGHGGIMPAGDNRCCI